MWSGGKRDFSGVGDEVEAFNSDLSIHDIEPPVVVAEEGDSDGPSSPFAWEESDDFDNMFSTLKFPPLNSDLSVR